MAVPPRRPADPPDVRYATEMDFVLAPQDDA
jgi:hypothetical protein